MATEIKVNNRYQEGPAMGQVNEPVEKDHSILAFCLGNVAQRANNQKVTREYQRLHPKRYRVKSKVARTIKVQEKTAVSNFSNALQVLLQQKGLSKNHERSFTAHQTYLPKAQGSLIDTVKTRLAKSARKSPGKQRTVPDYSQETMKTQASYLNQNDSASTQNEMMSPYGSSFRVKSAKKKSTRGEDVSNFSVEKQPNPLYKSATAQNTSSQQVIQAQQDKINQLATELENQDRLKQENEYFKTQYERLQAELAQYKRQ